MAVNQKHEMRWNIHPPGDQEGFKHSATFGTNTPIFTTEIKTASKTEVLEIKFLLICLKFHWIKELNT